MVGWIWLGLVLVVGMYTLSWSVSFLPLRVCLLTFQQHLAEWIGYKVIIRLSKVVYDHDNGTDWRKGMESDLILNGWTLLRRVGGEVDSRLSQREGLKSVTVGSHKWID